MAMDSEEHTAGAQRHHVFISYSHQDAEWLRRLQTHLKPYVRNEMVSVWDDTHIRAGARWHADIENALAAARVAVLLVSPDFLASDFIAEQELPPLLQAAEQEGLTILWVAVSYSAYEVTEIGAYQAANDPRHPLDSLSEPEQERVLVDVCKQIRDAVHAAGPDARSEKDRRSPVAGTPSSGQSMARRGFYWGGGVLAVAAVALLLLQFLPGSPAEPAVIEVAVLRPDEAGDVQVVLKHQDGQLMTDWSNPALRAHFDVSPETGYALQVAGLHVKAQRFDEVVSGKAGEHVYFGLDLVPRDSDTDGSLVVAPDPADFEAPTSDRRRASPQPVEASFRVDTTAVPLDHRIATLICALDLGVFDLGDCLGYAYIDPARGLALGFMGWNLREGSLQPLLQSMDRQVPEALSRIFGGRYDELRTILAADLVRQVEWSRSLRAKSTDPNNRALAEPWRSMFRALGQQPEFQGFAIRQARPFYNEGLQLCNAFGFRSERALAFMYDVQRDMPADQLVRLRRNFDRDADPQMNEEERLLLFIRHLSRIDPERAAPQDQRRRLLAEGEGVLGGVHFEIADLGITLANW